MQNWTLNASSGRNYFKGSFKEIRKIIDEPDCLISEILISGTFWPRPNHERNGSDLVLDYSVSLPQVVLRRDYLDNLTQLLAEWLEKPQEISIELSADKNQSLFLFFGKDPGLISAIDKPAFVVRYKGGTFRKSEWAFIVDQSCIRNFLQEIQLSLASI